MKSVLFIALLNGTIDIFGDHGRSLFQLGKALLDFGDAILVWSRVLESGMDSLKGSQGSLVVHASFPMLLGPFLVPVKSDQARQH